MAKKKTTTRKKATTTAKKKRKCCSAKQKQTLSKGQEISKRAMQIMKAKGKKTVTKTVYKMTLPAAMKQAKAELQREKRVVKGLAGK